MLPVESPCGAASRVTIRTSPPLCVPFCNTLTLAIRAASRRSASAFVAGASLMKYAIFAVSTSARRPAVAVAVDAVISSISCDVGSFASQAASSASDASAPAEMARASGYRSFVGVMAINLRSRCEGLQENAGSAAPNPAR